MTEWISLTQEEPVDPRRRIIDTHHHLKDPEQSSILGEHGDGDDRPYLAQHLHADMAGHHVIGSVYVECGLAYLPDGPEHLRPTGETAYAAAQAVRAAASGAPILAIVANTDIARTDVLEEVLDAHVAAGRGLFRGIRQMPVGYGGPVRDLLSEPAFRDGLEILGKRGFTFDAMLGFNQLKQLAAFAATVPATTLIVDHLGAPVISPGGPSREDVTAAWRDGIRALVPHANVSIKLGGIGMERVFGMDWSKQTRPPTSDTVVARWVDEVRFCIDTLGPDRCMFESNFPVDRLAVGYTVLWNAFQKMAAPYSDEEQDALFSGTAQRVYRI